MLCLTLQSGCFERADSIRPESFSSDFHVRDLIKVLRPIRRKRHDHFGSGTGQRPLCVQIDIQIFPAQPLPLGEVFEGSVFFEFFQTAADATFPA